MENRLYRDEQNKTIGGVCAGLADYFNADVTLVRLLFVFAGIVMGIGVPLYIVLWIVVPAKNRFFTTPVADYTVPPISAQPFAPVKRPVSGAALIGGTLLILFGSYFLLDQYDLIPDFDFDRFWPVILIVIGVLLIFTPGKQKYHFAPWDKKEPAVNEDTNDNLTTL